MYENYIEEHPGKCSYYVYRKVVSDDLKISFAQLGHEECEKCKLHDKTHPQKPLDFICEQCRSFEIHQQKYTEARALYDSHKGLSTDDHQFASGELQKIIMLPRSTFYKYFLMKTSVTRFTMWPDNFGAQNKN